MPEIVVEFPDSPEMRIITREDYNPREKDLLFAGQRERARIVERTLMGVDFEGQPFHPYSPRGPVYWYPKQGAPAAARRASVKYYAGKMREGKVTHSGLGIRFSNYAALKAAMGRHGGVVDLFSVGLGTHMLNAMEVRIDGQTIKIGIYTEPEATRALAHNEGRGHMPERRFLEVGDAESEMVASDVRDSWFKD